MPCRTIPKGPHESTRLFTKDMTAADAQKADRFMREYREWERNVARWRAFWSGAAPYWVGPRPRRPGPPPATPTITNTACQEAARVGVGNIYAALTAEVGARFECEGSCPGGHPCRKRFARSRGDGYSLTEKKTYCSFTVYGDCGCPRDPGPGPIEA